MTTFTTETPTATPFLGFGPRLVTSLLHPRRSDWMYSRLAFINIWRDPNSNLRISYLFSYHIPIGSMKKKIELYPLNHVVAKWQLCTIFSFLEKSSSKFNWMVVTDHSPQILWLMAPKGDKTSDDTRSRVVLSMRLIAAIIFLFFCLLFPCGLILELFEWAKAHLAMGSANKELNNRSSRVKGLLCIWEAILP